MQIKWELNPFPYAIVDNYLDKDQFRELLKELDGIKPELQNKFSSALEKKNIYKNLSLKKNSKKFVKKVGSREIKDVISSFSGGLPILSLGETENFSGYSTFHVTKSRGMLGSHVDHSDIQNGKYFHIANTIFYASSKWQKEWGGETILFSNNGLIPKVIIEPLPNRLIIFIHSANSFHGVKAYNPIDKTYRKTFYHDYYIDKKNKFEVIKFINKNRSKKLIFTRHGTTFIPFFPNGIKDISINKLLAKTNLKYIPAYLIYLINKKFKTNLISLRISLFKTIKDFLLN
tara:strand:- start:943 stop:1806 length:864 start_codon:yes stop_codon:yes gene_type:complete